MWRLNEKFSAAGIGRMVSHGLGATSLATAALAADGDSKFAVNVRVQFLVAVGLLAVTISVAGCSVKEQPLEKSPDPESGGGERHSIRGSAQRVRHLPRLTPPYVPPPCCHKSTDKSWARPPAFQTRSWC